MTSWLASPVHSTPEEGGHALKIRRCHSQMDRRRKLAPGVSSSPSPRALRSLLPSLLMLMLLLALSPGPCSGFSGLPVVGSSASSVRQDLQFNGYCSQRFQSAVSCWALGAIGAGGGAAAAASASDGNNARGPRQQREPPPPPPRNRKTQQPQQPISIESIAAALETGQSQASASGSNDQQQGEDQVWRRSPASGRVSAGAGARAYQQGAGAGLVRDAAPDRETGQILDSRDFERAGGLGVGGRDPKAFAGIVGGGGTGGGKKAKGNPNKLSLKKRRARDKSQSPEEKQMQNDVAAALKADSAEETLKCFNKAMEMKVPLRANLLSGVLNQCAKAGLMDDCMRVVMEMKQRGIVIEENTYVPLIRGMVSHGNCWGAFNLVKDMVSQGVQPRLRCYEPVIAEFCGEGDMDAAGEVWEHMEQQGVVPREEQYVNFLCGLGVGGLLWEHARSGKLDDKLLEMSYHARNLTMEQAEQLEQQFNAIPLTVTAAVANNSGSEGDADSEVERERKGAIESIVEDMRSSPPLAQRVKVPGGHEIDDDSWTRDWGSKTPVTERAYDNGCPACGDSLRAVGLTNDERARIRETLFGLAGLQVKKHARSRHTKLLAKNRQRLGITVNPGESPFYSFTDEDQKEQLQIFVDWLHSQRADGKTYTAVIDSANVAYHKGSAFHFSLPQVDLMVQALEAKGERPLVVIAEKYIDRVGDLYDNTPGQGGFKYMSNPLNKAIVKRWRAKSQLYECSDEASDDWYWMYAAVAFDDIPMTVISNDRTRDHRMSLAETVPYLRWRTTQLAQFELAFSLKEVVFKGVNQQPVWPRHIPQVAIQPPPAFTRDVQKSAQGCWHVPAGADDEWLCIDVQRGLRMGLDRLIPLQRRGRKIHPRKTGGGTQPGGDADADAYGGKVAVGDDGSVSAGGSGPLSVAVAEGDEKLKRVGGLLQSMRVKKQNTRAFRYSTQGTVEEAAMAAKRAAAKARSEAADADALAAEALFAAAQTATGTLPPGSEWAEALAADAMKVEARLAEETFAASLSEDGVVHDDSLGSPHDAARRGEELQEQQSMGEFDLDMARWRVGRESIGLRAAAAAAQRATAKPLPAATTATASNTRLQSSLPPSSASAATTPTPLKRSRKAAVGDTDDADEDKPVKPTMAPSRAVKVRHNAAAGAAAVAPRQLDRDSAASTLNGEQRQLEVVEEVVSLSGPSGVVVERVKNNSENGPKSGREGGLEVDATGEDDQGRRQQQQQQWASMTVVALKDELRQRGLKVSGKKAELVERLMKA